jgi:hypothetical protein
VSFANKKNGRWRNDAHFPNAPPLPHPPPPTLLEEREKKRGRTHHQDLTMPKLIGKWYKNLAVSQFGLPFFKEAKSGGNEANRTCTSSKKVAPIRRDMSPVCGCLHPSDNWHNNNKERDAKN